MKPSRVVWAVIALALQSSEALRAQQEVHTVTFEIRWYECTSPASVLPCACTSESEKQTACNGACLTWKLHTLGAERDFALAQSAYAGKANYFARDITRELYGIEYPRTPAGYPVRITDLYEQYEELGWVKLDRTQVKTGSLAVWPSVAGVVVSDSAGVTRILYPSAANRGAVITRDGETITQSQEPVYLVPRRFLANQAREQTRLNGP